MPHTGNRADPNYKSNSRPYGLPSSGARPFGQSERFRPAMSSAPWVGDKKEVNDGADTAKHEGPRSQRPRRR